MIEAWLQQAVKACAVPSQPSFETLERACLSLQLSLEKAPGLTSDYVREWLNSRGIKRRGIPKENRRLHGCMVAMADCGILFYDSSDTERQQRFTLAHEVAHFVLDHRLLRQRLLGIFGESILPVLDRKRDPSPQESLSLVFHRLSWGGPVQLMNRSASGAPSTGAAMAVEQGADLLAFELLAPQALAWPLVKHQSEPQAVSTLVEHFHLPRREARSYFHLLRLRLRELPPRPFFLDSLIEETSENG